MHAPQGDKKPAEQLRQAADREPANLLRPGGVAGFLLLPALPSPAPTPPASPCLGPGAPPAAGASLLVMKFGGSSLAGAEHLRRVAGIVRERLASRPVLVLSAMGKTTNELLASAERALSLGVVDISKVRETHESALADLGIPLPAEITVLLEELNRILSGIALLKEISARTRDLVVSFGERLSVRLFAAAFNKLAEPAGTAATSSSSGQPEARAVDSWDAGMLTTSGGGSASSHFSQCEVMAQTYPSLAAYFAPLKREYAYVPVMTGYIAKDPQGTITTLGRDGSDLSATVLAAAVEASEIQIWKDVDGIMTTDPRVVANARPVEVLTFEEAAELSSFGAKVVHPAAILPAWMAKVPIRVLNSTAPELPGTRIVAEFGPNDERSGRVAAMSSKHNITMIMIRSTRMLGQHGFLAHVFQLFNKFEVSVDVIATSEVTVSLTLDLGFKAVDLEGLTVELEKVASVDIREGMAMLTLITAKRDSNTVLRESFEAFEKLDVKVEMVSHGASNVNVTFVIADPESLRCAQKLHELFFER